MNTRNVFCDHNLKAEIAREKGRLLTAGSLPIVGASDDRVSLTAVPPMNISCRAATEATLRDSGGSEVLQIGRQNKNRFHATRFQKR